MNDKQKTYYLLIQFLINCKQLSIPGICIQMRDDMSKTTKVSIHVGDFDFDAEGGQFEVEERLAQFKQEGLWDAMLERIQETIEFNKEAASVNPDDINQPERGANFCSLLENYALDGKPEQVLGAFHFLREIEKLDDCPPRVINSLFEDARIEPPGNLSLYINRLKDRNFLKIPSKHGDKNRYAELTDEGREHLEEKSERM